MAPIVKTEVMNGMQRVGWVENGAAGRTFPEVKVGIQSQSEVGGRARPLSSLVMKTGRGSVLPIALCNMTECSSSALANTAVTSHVCLLGTWNVVIVTEALNFLFIRF